MSPPTNNWGLKQAESNLYAEIVSKYKKIEKMSNTDPPINWGSTQVHGNGK